MTRHLGALLQASWGEFRNLLPMPKEAKESKKMVPAHIEGSSEEQETQFQSLQAYLGMLELFRFPAKN